MSHQHRRSVSNQVLVELVEADVDTGFSLVDVAVTEFCRGNALFAGRALQQAEAVPIDIEQRLTQLGPDESLPFQPLVEELRRQMHDAKSQHR